MTPLFILVLVAIYMLIGLGWAAPRAMNHARDNALTDTDFLALSVQRRASLSMMLTAFFLAVMWLPALAFVLFVSMKSDGAEMATV